MKNKNKITTLSACLVNQRRSSSVYKKKWATLFWYSANSYRCVELIQKLEETSAIMYTFTIEDTKFSVSDQLLAALQPYPIFSKINYTIIIKCFYERSKLSNKKYSMRTLSALVLIRSYYDSIGKPLRSFNGTFHETNEQTSIKQLSSLPLY